VKKKSGKEVAVEVEGRKEGGYKDRDFSGFHLTRDK
jgi:hypothetical protein